MREATHEREKQGGREGERQRERENDRERQREREGERQRERENDREREKGNERERERAAGNEREAERKREREREATRERKRERQRVSKCVGERERLRERERDCYSERESNQSSGHSRHLAGSSYATAAAVIMRADAFSALSATSQNEVGNTHRAGGSTHWELTSASVDSKLIATLDEPIACAVSFIMGTVVTAALAACTGGSWPRAWLADYVWRARRGSILQPLLSPRCSSAFRKGSHCGMDASAAVAGCTGRDGTILNDRPPAAEAARSRPEHRMGRLFSPMSTPSPCNQPQQQPCGWRACISKR